MVAASPKKTEPDAATFASRRALAHLFSEFERARAEKDAAESRLSRFAETIQLFLANLPPDAQPEFLKRFQEIRDGVQQRGGEVFNNVVALFKRDHRPEWTISAIQTELEKTGAAPEPKALSNAVLYLAKTGRLRRVGRGQYIVEGSGAGIQMDGPDDGHLWATEHEV
jgi:hypothetical protein